MNLFNEQRVETWNHLFLGGNGFFCYYLSFQFLWTNLGSIYVTIVVASWFSTVLVNFYGGILSHALREINNSLTDVCRGIWDFVFIYLDILKFSETGDY